MIETAASNDTDELYLRRAIALSAQALKTAGTEPFGAVVVRDGRVIGEGLNRSVASLDPTSHGETEAIRDACRNLGKLDLGGAVLYSSCEPCALCVAAMHIAGIQRLCYAATLAESNAALDHLPPSERLLVDVNVLRQECGKEVGQRSMPSRQALAGEAMDVIEEWSRKRRTP